MAYTHQSVSNFDALAFEVQHQEDYERACQEREFALEYRENSHSTYEDGKYDGELDIEPQPYQWFEPLYRKGYLAGVTNRFNEQFSA